MNCESTGLRLCLLDLASVGRKRITIDKQVKEYYTEQLPLLSTWHPFYVIPFCGLHGPCLLHWAVQGYLSSLATNLGQGGITDLGRSQSVGYIPLATVLFQGLFSLSKVKGFSVLGYCGKLCHLVPWMYVFEKEL